LGNAAKKVAGKGLLFRDTTPEIAARCASNSAARLIRQDPVFMPSLHGRRERGRAKSMEARRP
jgi:hypothetical protein